MTPVMETAARMAHATQKMNVVTKVEKPMGHVPKVMESAASSLWDVVIPSLRMVPTLKAHLQWLANVTSRCVLATKTSVNFD